MPNRPAVAIASFLAGILMLLVIAACGDSPTPRPAVEINPPPSPTPTLPYTAVPTPTIQLESIPTPSLTPTPTPTPTPRPTEAPADFAIAISGETTWGEVYTLFASDEQDCINQAMGDEVDVYLGGYLFSHDGLGGWEAEVYACISPDKATRLFTGALVMALEYEGADPSDEEIDCIESWAAAKDLAYVVRQMDEDEAIIEEVFVCVVDSFARLIVEEIAESYGSEGEDAQCLEDVFDSLSEEDRYAAIFGASNEEIDNLWVQMMSCIPEGYGYEDERHSQGAYWSDPAVGKFVAISAGYETTCGILEGGEAVCWGSDAWGVSAPPDVRFKSISLSESMACGLDVEDQLVCWGDDYFAMPDFTHGASFSSIDVGPLHGCGVRVENKTLYCWGENAFGQVEPVPNGEFTAVTVGVYHSCAIRIDGKTICWGDDYVATIISPPDVSLISISAGDSHTCGVMYNGPAVCWGEDKQGQSTPPQTAFLSVASGAYHTCGLAMDGSAQCWGLDEIGVEPPDAEFKELATGFSHVCGIAADGRVACWGAGYWGEHVPPGAELPN